MRGGDAGAPPAEVGRVGRAAEDLGSDEAATGTVSAGLASAAPVASRGGLWLGRAVILVAVAAAAAALNAAGSGITRDYLANTWQLLDLDVLADDPVGSVWYLHTQPPGYNAAVATIAWLPAPIAGTLFALDVAALAGTALLLQGILVRSGVGTLTAGGVATVAVLSPSLVNTIGLASYEVLVCLLVVAAIAAGQRYLDGPRTFWLVAASALLTAAALTRSLLHPVWVLAVLALLMAARPPGRRAALAALAVPVLLIGGWTLKNQVVFGTATTSSWLGFNLQRGVVGPMDADLVRADVAAGRVSDLARVAPWGPAEAYRPWSGTCEPHDHPATREPDKGQSGLTTTNFNHECYLPVYREARANALTLARRHPAEYLADRGTALTLSFVHSTTRASGRTTWLDTVYGPLLLSVDHEVSQEGWNVPLFAGGQPIPVTVSLTLAGLCAFVLGRGVVAVVRLVRRGWSGRAGPDGWPTGEVVWLLVSATVALVVLGGDLVEIGENTRFRAMVDPLLIAFPLGALALAAAGWRDRPRCG